MKAVQRTLFPIACVLCTFCGCAAPCRTPTIAKESTGMVRTVIDAATQAPETQGSVINLPDELSVTCESSYYLYRAFRFELSETRHFAIDIARDSGTLLLGIQDTEANDYVYKMREFDTEQDSMTLAPGSYAFTIRAKRFIGSVHITGSVVGSTDRPSATQ